LNNLHINLNEFTNASRVLKQTNSLVKSGFAKNIEIAALYSEGLQKTQKYAPNITCNRFELISRGWGKNFITQVFKYIEFCWRVYWFYKHKNIKMVNIHSLGLLPLGLLLKWTYKAKLVYDTHELETETNGTEGFRKKVAKLLEKRLIKYVDLTLVVSENIANWYANEYGMPRPPAIMNAPVYEEPLKSDVFREKFAIRPDQVIFLYQGCLVKGRGVKLLLDAFKARTDDKAVIVFMGYGELENDIQQAMQTTSNIYFHPAVPPNVVLEHTVAGDIGFSFIERTCLSYYYCMPNKLFEYAMAGLPVIVSNMKEMREFVEKYGFGLIAEEASPVGLYQAIDKILACDLETMKANAKHAAKENSWEHQEQKMLNAYAKLLNKEKHHDT
jgi:glycosyltransferase involved in cell wall biosynthesis